MRALKRTDLLCGTGGRRICVRSAAPRPCATCLGAGAARMIATKSHPSSALAFAVTGPAGFDAGVAALVIAWLAGARR
jgi:hypothetical protein